MRVTVISQYYPPEGAAALYAASVGRGLQRSGHDVRVLTGYPNYPDGRIFDGYQQRWRTYEQDGDVGLCRVPLFTDHSQHLSRRILNYLSSGLSSASILQNLDLAHEVIARGNLVVTKLISHNVIMTVAPGRWVE